MSYSLIERLQTKANPDRTNTTTTPPPPPPRDLMGNAATVNSSPEFSVVTIHQACQALGVSRSGFYAHQVAHRQRLTEHVVCTASVHLKAAFAASHKAYGSRRLKTAMAERGLAMGRHRARTLMRLNGLRPVWRRKFVQTTDGKHGLAVSPNVLNRQFEQALPNQVWVADITYIRTRSSWLVTVDDSAPPDDHGWLGHGQGAGLQPQTLGGAYAFHLRWAIAVG